eukprot:3684534-Rhodomonas_salina.1
MALTVMPWRTPSWYSCIDGAVLVAPEMHRKEVATRSGSEDMILQHNTTTQKCGSRSGVELTGSGARAGEHGRRGEGRGGSDACESDSGTQHGEGKRRRFWLAPPRT